VVGHHAGATAAFGGVVVQVRTLGTLGTLGTLVVPFAVDTAALASDAGPAAEAVAE
jgi:hypothetical protein